MKRFLLAAIAMFSLAAGSYAGPIPWTYSIWMKPAGGADDILLGHETLWEYDHSTGIETGTPYHVVQGMTKDGDLRTDTSTPTDKVTLFDFGHGDWQTKSTLPADVTYAQNRFVLQYLFTADTGNSSSFSVSGSVEGSLSAAGIFTSGTGNYSIGIDQAQDIELDLGRKAKLRFTADNHESHSTISMKVTPVAVDTPEPGTLALGGIGLAGLAGFKLRRKARVRAGKR